jgi:hypothetical protein
METATPRDQIKEAAQSAKDAAEATLGRQKDSAANTLGSLAGALRNAAENADAEGQGAGSMARWAADGLDRVSSNLRSKDLGGMLRDVEGFARNQPLAFFVASVTAGFLATRFLKAGAGDERPQRNLLPPPDETAGIGVQYPTLGP